jgi:hypothetical protein
MSEPEVTIGWQPKWFIKDGKMIENPDYVEPETNVCECERWEPSEYDDLNKEITRLSRIEDVALEVVTEEVWHGDKFYDKLCKLRDVLGEG